MCRLESVRDRPKDKRGLLLFHYVSAAALLRPRRRLKAGNDWQALDWLPQLKLERPPPSLVAEGQREIRSVDKITIAAHDQNRQRSMKRAMVKSRWIAVVIVCAYLVSWIPYYISMLVHFLSSGPDVVRLRPNHSSWPEAVECLLTWLHFARFVPYLWIIS